MAPLVVCLFGSAIVMLLFVLFFCVKAMTAKEKRLQCNGENCDAQGPSDKRANWIIEPDLKLVYIETRKEEQVSADVSGGQCSVKNLQ